jgi:hypothetical protein
VPLHSVADVSDGNHLSIADDFVDEGIRYLRGQDLTDFFISDGDPIYIPETIYRALVRSHMHSGDVLVGIVGTIGTVALVTDRYEQLTGSCKIAIVRPRSMPGEYVAAYLASRLGQYEIQRRIRGAVQMGLILPDLREIPILEPSKALRQKVVTTVRTAEAERRRSAETMRNAELKVMKAIGLHNLNLNPSRSYTRYFSDLEAATRFGAEYFMPAKKRVLDAMRRLPHRTLEFHAPSMRELWSPDDAGVKETIRNFDLPDALEPYLDDSKEPVLAATIGSTKNVLNAGDVVISRLRSYLKEIAVVRTAVAVGSSEFIVLRPTDSWLSAEALMVFLRCPLVQTVLKWSQDGSNHPRFNEQDLLSIPVPDALQRVQREIDRLVRTAIDAKQKSRDLLERAKSAIEEAVDPSAKA